MLCIEVTLEDFSENQVSLANDFDLTMSGLSLGGAAAQLGLSRYAIHKAMDRGLLESFRVLRPDGGLMAIFIPQRALDAYRRDHLNLARQRKTA